MSGRVDLDHRQPPTGRGDHVTLPGVRLLAAPRRVELLLPAVAVGDGRRRWSLLLSGLVAAGAVIIGDPEAVRRLVAGVRVPSTNTPAKALGG
jgi:hypothetical protein